MSQAISVTMGNYAQLAIRGKTHYKANVTVNEGGSAKDLSGYSALTLELKAKDDEDGPAISTVALTFTSPPGDGSTGLLDIDITSANTGVIQDGTVFEGVFDAIGTVGGEVELLFHGDWALTKGVTG
tara:strand:+ start:1244 stop:1624 length:381 start_codon:yes stop_codon:yes gene_type:complete